MRDRKDYARGLAARLTKLMTGAEPEQTQGPLHTKAMGGRDRKQVIREISYIAERYGWQSLIEVELEITGASSLRYLDQDALEQLLERMRTMVDNAMAGCDLADDLPAR